MVRRTTCSTLKLKEKFGQPQFVLEQIAENMKDGDVASVTDLSSSYISNSPKYKNQDQFAEAIGTTRQTLHRMLSHSPHGTWWRNRTFL